MSIVQQVAKNTGVILSGNVTRILINLVVVIYLARYLGSTGFGQYSFIFAYLGFFGILTDLGINRILIREISRDKEKASKLMGNGILMKSLLSSLAVIAAVLMISLMHYPREIILLVYIVSLNLILVSFVQLYNVIFQANVRMEYPTLAEILGRLLFAALVFGVIFLKGNLCHVVLATIIANVPILILLIWFSKKFVKPKFEVDFKLWKEILKESWPLALTAAFIIIYLRIDVIMLSKMKGDAAVGFYSAAVRLVETLSIIPGAFMMSVFPLMSQYFKTSQESLTRVYQLSLKYMLMFIIPIAVGTTLLARQITTTRLMSILVTLPERITPVFLATC